MKNITKLHEYAAKYLYHTIQMEIGNIAKEISITKKQVEKILDLPKQNSSIPTTTSSANNTEPNLMINKTQNNRGGVSIMTAAASSQVDEINKQSINTISRTARNAIFRPKN